MSHQCQNGSCCCQSHSPENNHSHGRSCQSGCGCGCSQCSCQSGCGQQKDHCCSKAADLLAIADKAWMEVLKEKIKDHIRASDSKIDELAKVVAEANHAKWKGKMIKKQACDDFERKIQECLYDHNSCCSSNNPQGGQSNEGSNKPKM